MAKFMVLYSSTVPASEVMANSTPEEMKASMEQWMAWREEAQKTVKAVDFGTPLQSVSHLSSDGVTEGANQTSGYSIIEGESKDAVVAVLTTHPHLQRSGNSIDVLEMLSMPGM